VEPAKPYPGFSPFSAEEKQRRLARHVGMADYLDFLGMRLLDLEPGYARLELPFRREMTHSGGVVQGGLITTLADSSIAHATVAALDPATQRTATIELKINFIRPATGTLFTSVAHLIHLGRRTAVGEAEVTDERGRLIAKCLATIALLPREPQAPEARSEAG
jgi:acyl-CoA thioesterase